MKKVVIIGGGVSGLVASWVFNQCGADVRLFEPGPKGRGFLSGGLKYFVRTDDMVRIVNDLGLAFSVQSVRGGIFLQGQVRPYPKHLREVGQARAQRIREDHYRKTRGVEPTGFAVKSMNDPFSATRKALACDLDEFIKRLSGYKSHCHVSEMVTSVNSSARRVYTAEGASWNFDYLVVTAPLWIARRLLDFPLPDGMARKLNVVDVDSIGSDPYARWDYVYTPYTPENMVHRLSPHDGGYSVEFNGEWSDSTSGRLRNELNFLFGNAWALNDVKKGLPGHLIPLESDPEYPPWIAPLGRFAAWDPRATTDKTLSDAIALARRWGFSYDDD